MTYGRLAQLVEHLLDVQEVTGSSPVPSTTSPQTKRSGDFFRGGGTGREPGQTKAEYHHGVGALPFALHPPILRVSGQSLRTCVHGRYARTQEEGKVFAYRGVLSAGSMIYLP